jgi:hypothetical protein
VITCLEAAGLSWKNGQRYLLSQCPLPEHDDRHASAQIFKNDWWVNCLSGCGRFPLTRAFPSLRPNHHIPKSEAHSVTPGQAPAAPSAFNLFYDWLNLPCIPRDHQFKGLPLDVLDQLGWRWTDGSLGMGSGYFIPYFAPNGQDIPFAQVRHLDGDRRFSFLSHAQPVLYGLWNLHDNMSIFVVEGCSDGATLAHTGILWVAVPSASSTTLIQELGRQARQRDIQLVYAGDKDEAGDKLRAALDEVAHYRVCQPPEPHKDWSDFFQAEGGEALRQHTEDYR